MWLWIIWLPWRIASYTLSFQADFLRLTTHSWALIDLYSFSLVDLSQKCSQRMAQLSNYPAPARQMAWQPHRVSLRPTPLSWASRSWLLTSGAPCRAWPLHRTIYSYVDRTLSQYFLMRSRCPLTKPYAAMQPQELRHADLTINWNVTYSSRSLRRQLKILSAKSSSTFKRVRTNELASTPQPMSQHTTATRSRASSRCMHRRHSARLKNHFFIQSRVCLCLCLNLRRTRHQKMSLTSPSKRKRRTCPTIRSSSQQFAKALAPM